MSGGERPGARWGACLLALMLGACSATKVHDGAPASVAPSPTRDGEGESMKAEASEEAEAAWPGEDLDELDAEVQQAWSELEGLDQEREKASAAGKVDGSMAARCERIRGLADQICTLSQRMCGLAVEHPGQARYASACVQSEDTCERARQAAERCPE